MIFFSFSSGHRPRQGIWQCRGFRRWSRCALNKLSNVLQTKSRECSIVGMVQPPTSYSRCVTAIRILVILILAVYKPVTGQTVGITGVSVPALASFDQVMTTIMNKYGIPGAQLAVSTQGRLVLARGYGLADVDSLTPVQPDSLFRIASLSKQVTSVAILQLVQNGRLGLDDAAFSYLPDLHGPTGVNQDSRIAEITIRNLLQHSGGWNRNVSPDPMFDDSITAATTLGEESPASSETLIRYMLGKPLDFDPGTQFEYSNFGYCVLGRILERITKQPYEDYIRSQVLAGLGIDRMHIGQSLAAGRAPGEVTYYMQVGSAEKSSVFPYGPTTVPEPYGGYYLEAQDSHGVWLASAPALLKFWNAIDGLRGATLLNAQSLAQMTQRPSIPYWTDTPVWYGLGFYIIPADTGYDWWHDGSVPGARTYVLRTHDGYAWAALFNMRLNNSSDDANFFNDLVTGLRKAQSAVTTWPSTDQFGDFGPLPKPAPAIDGQNGVLSAANFQRGIVPGSWASIFGASFSGQTSGLSSSDIFNGTFPTALNGVQVTFVDESGNTASGYVSYVSPGQINVQVPSGLAAGGAQVKVTYGGQTSYPVVAQVLNNAPGLFQYFAGSQSYASAFFPDGTLAGDPTVTASSRAATPGDVISLYGTGFAPSPSGAIAPSPASVNATVSIGGTAAPVQFAGLVGPGLFQVNVTVPKLTSGDFPVAVTVNGVTSFGNPVLSVRP